MAEAIADTAGMVSFKFNQDLLVPEIFKNIGRRLIGLEKIQVDRDIGKLEMIVNSDDEALSDL